MAIWREYLARKLYNYNNIPESILPTLEPVRRTDHTPDDLFAEQLGKPGEFFLEKDIFYLLMIHNQLSQYSYLVLMLWRGRSAKDFTDQEKQRFALLVRYILALSTGLAQTSIDPSHAFRRFATQYGLTPTETEILAALIQGHSPRAIAGASGRSYGTVRWHVQNILEKSQAGTRQQLMREFYKLMNSAQK